MPKDRNTRSRNWRLDAAPHSTVVPPGLFGREILQELPLHDAPVVLRALRLILAYSQQEEGGGLPVPDEKMREFEEDLLRSSPDHALWAPLAVLAGAMRDSDERPKEMIAAACLALADWAVRTGARVTGALFAQAAALAWPENARYAWITGRMLRNRDRLREAEGWFQRSLAVAVAGRDPQVQALSLNSLGTLYLHTGSLAEARRYLERAYRVARKHGLKERRAGVLHDLFVLSLRMGEHTKAETYARRSLELYGPENPALSRLAHDVAHLWSTQGHFARALPVFRALLPHFSEKADRLRVLASTARASGATGDREGFEACWAEAWPWVRPELGSALLADVCLELGLGAASLREWARAGEALGRALQYATQSEANETAVRVESALDHVKRHERADVPRPPAGIPGVSEVLAASLVRSLAHPLDGGERDEPG